MTKILNFCITKINKTNLKSLTFLSEEAGKGQILLYLFTFNMQNTLANTYK